MQLRPLSNLILCSILGLAVTVLAGGGCAGVKPGAATTGTAGTGGNVPPPINGLSALTVSPKTTAVSLTMGATSITPATVNLTATGTVNGATMDVTSMVQWVSNLPGAVVVNGVVTVNSPGSYTITAKSGSVSDTATISASFNGDMFGDGFVTTNNNKTVLDGSPSGSAQLAYPLDKTLFPANLSPIYAQIQTSGGAIARLNFQGTGVNINFYGNCEAGMPGSGCYVKMPLTLTRLLIGPSEMGDIMMTARVSNGGAPAESSSISVAWASLGLSGGLYYWSTIPNPPKKPSGDTSGTPTPPNYILLDPDQTNGTEILRYAFTSDGTDPKPAVVWTDDGGPSSNPPYDGAPPAINSNVAKGHCIGCHAISNDGRYMTLTIGGSAPEAANFALLDIGMQTLIQLSTNPNAGTSASPTNNQIEYWKQFRAEGLATENTWGPKGDRVVSMFQSKLYLTQVSVAGTMGTATRMGTVVPTWQSQEQYATDPFWSQDGSLFVFTSFASPDIGNYNTAGTNGDMKKGGQIVIATASDTGINDDAHVLINRGNGVTSYYPSISNDSKLVVFNTSTCGTDPDSNKSSTDYGNQSCDGYDDSSAQLWVVAPTGGASTKLVHANGGDSAYDNSWPRFSPDKGMFRGNDLYWVAFSSRRPYGLQLNTGGGTTTKPQLWIAGVVRGEIVVGDPSYSPAWLPAQNPNQAAPNGNHVPQWVKVAVVID
jgi:hypothetical protein